MFCSTLGLLMFLNWRCVRLFAVIRDCSSREHAEAIAFYRAGGTERELVATRLQTLLSSRTLLIWWQRNLEAFQLSYQYVLEGL
jgi:DMSO/TMAO reductase YedYZ molybdopterin-dependent catalytic subunit